VAPWQRRPYRRSGARGRSRGGGSGVVEAVAVGVGAAKLQQDEGEEGGREAWRRMVACGGRGATRWRRAMWNHGGGYPPSDRARGTPLPGALERIPMRVAQNARGVVNGVIKGVTRASFGSRAPLTPQLNRGSERRREEKVSGGST